MDVKIGRRSWKLPTATRSARFSAGDAEHRQRSATGAASIGAHPPTIEEPDKPEDIAAVTTVTELLWQLDEPNRPNVARTFSQARAAQTTYRYERVATELWQRGWLNTARIVDDAGGPNSA